MNYKVFVDTSATAHIAQRVDVYVFTPGSIPHLLRVTPEGEMRWEEQDPNKAAEHPTYRFPQEVAAEIAAAILDVAPANREQGAALKDAREVRDRLLTIVEKVVP